MKITLEYRKNIQLKVTSELHKMIKRHCLEEGCTIKDYIESVVRADLKMRQVDKKLI
jgi:hypothetical protein